MRKLILFFLLPTVCLAQGIRNPSYNRYEMRVVCKGKIIREGILESGACIENMQVFQEVEVFYRVIFKRCDTENPEKPIMETLPIVKNTPLPNGWKMVKVPPNVIQNLPLQICPQRV